VEKTDTNPWIVQTGSRTEVKLTSLRRRGVMLRQKMRSGRSLGTHKILLTPEKEVDSSVQRSRLFRTACTAKDRKCKVIVDSGSTDNLVSTEMVENWSWKQLSTRVHIKSRGYRKDTG
jgi:hypothetical protein